MENVRKIVFKAIKKEREKQEEHFSLQEDIQQIETDLLKEGVKQRFGQPFDYKKVGRSLVVVSSIATAMLEALIEKGDVEYSDLIKED